MSPAGRGRRCGRQQVAATEIVEAVPELKVPLGALSCSPLGGRHVDRAIHSLGPTVRFDILYPAKRECPGRGINDVREFSEYSRDGIPSA